MSARTAPVPDSAVENPDNEGSMASLNRVFLIGIVASPPILRDGAWELVLGVPTERAGRAGLDRVRIIATGRAGEEAGTLRSAQEVYADGRLVHAADGPLVEARALFAIGDPPPQAATPDERGGSHASPRPHDRAGHARRLHAGTPRERVVWVRPTRVGGRFERRRPRPIS